MGNLDTWVGIVAVAGGGGTFLAWIPKAWRFFRLFDRFIADWNGQPQRPGQDAKPGVMAHFDALDEHNRSIDARLSVLEGQMATVHHELTPNSGHSMKDQMNRVDPAFRAPTAGEPEAD